MAEAKTRPTGASVDAFLNGIKDKDIRHDCQIIAGIMKQATGSNPKMWGSGIVGFGTQLQEYTDGREAEWMVTAFSPRKQNITLYINPQFDGREELLDALGSFTCGKSCVYIKRLSDVDLSVLKRLVAASVKHTRKQHPV